VQPRRSFELWAVSFEFLLIAQSSKLTALPLFLQIQRVDHLLVVLRLVHPEVREELAAARDLGDESATRGIVLPVIFEMLGHLFDLLRENGDLDGGRARVLLVKAVLGDDLLLRSALENHRVVGVIAVLRAHNMKRFFGPPERRLASRKRDSRIRIAKL